MGLLLLCKSIIACMSEMFFGGTAGEQAEPRVGGRNGWKKEKIQSWETRGSEWQIESWIWRCGAQGDGPLCPAGDYRWPSELNQNCADCQGMGSATHRVPHERGGNTSAAGGGRSRGLQTHTAKIAFKWVFEISKNKLPLKKLNRQLIWGLDGGQVKSCPLHSSAQPLLHLGIIHFLTSHPPPPRTHQHACR